MESAIDTSTLAGQYEAKYLADYKESIVRLSELQKHLEEINAELKEISFSKGKRDVARRRALRDEKIKTQNRIAIYEKKLKRLEASKALRDLTEGSYKGIPFKEGDGFKVNWGGDRILQYHPKNLSHHGGEYFKISSGKTGTIRIDLDGNIIE